MRRLALTLAVILTLLALAPAATAEMPPIDVMGFVFDKCGNCGATTRPAGCGECAIYLDIFGRARISLLHQINEGRVTFDMHNVIYGQYRPEYYAYCDAFGVPQEKRNQFPQFFVGAPENGFVLIGEEEMALLPEKVRQLTDTLPDGARTAYPEEELEAAMSKLDLDGSLLEPEEETAEAEPEAEPAGDEGFHREDDLSALTDTDTKIVYVYKPECEFCAKVRPLLEGLPDSVTLPDGTPSRIVFASLNKDDYDQYQIVKEYYEKLAIPEDHQYSPLLIVGGSFYMGYDEIVPNLMNAILRGDGVETDLTPILEAEE